jgi:hypothetical protein
MMLSANQLAAKFPAGSAPEHGWKRALETWRKAGALEEGKHWHWEPSVPKGASFRVYRLSSICRLVLVEYRKQGSRPFFHLVVQAHYEEIKKNLPQREKSNAG